jgi:hypothetical protein
MANKKKQSMKPEAHIALALAGVVVTAALWLGKRGCCRVMVVAKGTRKRGRGVGGMGRRAAAWVAWSLRAACAALIALALLLNFLTFYVPSGLPGEV